MYTTLVGLTCFIMFILVIGVFTPIDATDQPTKKEILIEILISLSFLADVDTVVIHITERRETKPIQPYHSNL